MTLPVRRAQQRWCLVIAVVACRALFCGSLSAQLPDVLVPPVSEKDCRKAAHVVEKGKPDKKEEAAFATIVRCRADVGPAGASAVRAMRAETDTATLYATVAAFWDVVDANLMTADLDVLRDATASAPARVFAAHAILVMATHGRTRADYAQLVSGGTACRVSVVMVRPVLGAPLPAGYLETMRSVLSATASSSSAPAPVRNAASCALAYLPDAP